MDVPQQEMLPPNFCEWCCAIGNSRCGRCHSVFYCCREHQVKHWALHKKDCKQIPLESPHNVQMMTPQQCTYTADPSMDNLPPYANPDAWNQNLPLQNPITAQNSFDPDLCLNKQMDYSTVLPSEEEMFSSLSSELLSSDNNFWEIIDACDAQNLLNCGTDLERDEAIAKISANLLEGAPDPSFLPPDDPGNPGLLQGQTLNDICANVVHDLNTYGICVLDSFIGTKFGTAILNEVKGLYNTGIFKKGELVNPNPLRTNESIRNDVTTWVNGTEPECPYIGSLMRKLDLVMTTCNKLKNNGQLAKYKLHRRTKAMIACYPADGTYYKKHIDNPHKDGRCITCIYYLNQNWNAEEHGGVLRMFPSAYDSQVANIEPIFDRMIFFWSDKRNPHEVLPSFATRFALTVWYFDADERDQALLSSRAHPHNRQPQPYAKC